MRFGLQLESTGVNGDPRVLADLAVDAEAAGWDGFFVSDPGYPTMGGPEALTICDTWVALAAVALATERMRIGTLVTPLPRYRPYEVALRAASLDRLSDGRLTMTVSPGHKKAFELLGEDTDNRGRIDKLRESLAILAGLWTGEPFSYEGTHFTVCDLALTPRPVQQPRIPIHICAWNLGESVDLAAQWDGVHVGHFHQGVSCEQRGCVDRMTSLRARLPDTVAIALEGVAFQPDSPPDLVRGFADAGVEWWMESAWLYQAQQHDLDALRTRIRKGPPR